MAESIFFGNVLRDGRWNTCTAAVSTLDEAIELVKSHYKMEPTDDSMRRMFQADPDLEFRVYWSNGDGWASTIVEVIPDDERPMVALAVYKIMEGQLAGS